jgi:hypothetical protein
MKLVIIQSEVIVHLYPAHGEAGIRPKYYSYILRYYHDVASDAQPRR